MIFSLLALKNYKYQTLFTLAKLAHVNFFNSKFPWKFTTVRLWLASYLPCKYERYCWKRQTSSLTTVLLQGQAHVVKDCNISKFNTSHFATCPNICSMICWEILDETGSHCVDILQYLGTPILKKKIFTFLEEERKAWSRGVMWLQKWKKKDDLNVIIAGKHTSHASYIWLIWIYNRCHPHCTVSFS